MRAIAKPLFVALIALGGIAAPAALVPASAAVSQASPSTFVETLVTDGLGALGSGSQAQRRAGFRAIIEQHFAVESIGDRLIASWRNRITPAQYQAYRAALPGFLMGTYADRLTQYANATVTVNNAIERNGSHFVQTRIAPRGSNPANVIWQLSRTGNRYQVVNVQVSGINLTLNQAQDFNSYIQRNGFDRLVAFMESRG